MELAPRRFGDTVVLAPVGRIDHATAEGFRIALLTQLDACAAGRDRVVLDLSGVAYIASVGLRALMLAAKQAKAQNSVLVVAAMQPLVREVFRISRVDLVLSSFASVREALGSISPTAQAAFDDA